MPLPEPDADLVQSEMVHIAQTLEQAGHVFTEASAMAMFCLGIRTLVGYGLPLPVLVQTMARITKASYADREAALATAGRLVDSTGRPL